MEISIGPGVSEEKVIPFADKIEDVDMVALDIFKKEANRGDLSSNFGANIPFFDYTRTFQYNTRLGDIWVTQTANVMLADFFFAFIVISKY